jgi:hypothetical protein
MEKKTMRYFFLLHSPTPKSIETAPAKLRVARKHHQIIWLARTSGLTNKYAQAVIINQNPPTPKNINLKETHNLERVFFVGAIIEVFGFFP